MEYKDIKTYNDLYEFMRENIKYGYVSKKDNKIYRRKLILDDSLYETILHKYYYLQTTKELLKSKCGICYDQVELQRDWLNKHGYETYTYYSRFHNHSFLIFKDKNKYVLFERSYDKNNGIYYFDNMVDCLEFYKNMQLNDKPILVYKIDIFFYKKPVFGIDFQSFLSYVRVPAQKITLYR